MTLDFLKPPKLDAIGVVRDATGKIKYDDFESLCDELKLLILQEDAEQYGNINNSST